MLLQYFKRDHPLMLTIRPGKPQRDWMDATPVQFAYRCLPMSIAGSAGWELLNPVAFSAMWTGKKSREAIKIKCEESHPSAISHFGHGLLSFRIGMFRTEKRISLWVGGPPNMIRDGIQPLSAVVETDWLPMTFTMTWKFTRKRHWVHFEKDEPICFLYPIDLSLIENTRPVIEDIGDYPELENDYLEWRESRSQLNERLLVKKDGGYETTWQKFYFRGTKSDGTPTDTTHRTKMNLLSFLDRTKTDG